MRLDALRHKLKDIRIAVLLLLLVTSVIGPAATASAASKQSKAVILVIERLRVADVTEEKTPNLHKLMNDNAAGLISLRKVFAYENVSSALYATMGSGRAAVGLEPRANESEAEPVAASPPDRAAAIASANKKHGTGAVFGAFGEAVRRAGLSTGALMPPPGSGQTDDFLNIVSDSSGRIDQVEITGQGRLNGLSGYTDVESFSGQFQELIAGNDVVLVSYADLVRAENAEAGPDSEIFRPLVLAQTDQIVGRIVDELDPRDMLVLLAAPDRGRLAGDLIGRGEPLSPVIIKAPGFAGLLTSKSTARPGIVSANDVMPTILAHLRVKSGSPVDGSPAETIERSPDKAARLDHAAEKALRHYLYLPPAIAAAVIFCIATLILALVFLIRGAGKISSKFISVPLLAIFLLPLALTVAGALNFPSVWPALICVGLIAALAVPISILLPDRFIAAEIIVGSTAVLFLIDALLGQTLLSSSFLSGSVLTGGRYFGLGDPLIGVLFIYTVLAAVLIGARHPDFTGGASFKIALGLSFAALFIVVGFAKWGASTSWLIALCATLPYLFNRLTVSRPTSVPMIGLFAVIAIAMIAGFTALESALSPAAGGLIETVSVAARAPARIGGVVFLVLVVGAYFALRGRFHDVTSRLPLFRLAMPAIAVAGFLALVFSETGLQAFSIIALYSLTAALYLKFNNSAVPTAPAD